jgi:hypothetical protein
MCFGGSKSQATPTASTPAAAPAAAEPAPTESEVDAARKGDNEETYGSSSGGKTRVDRSSQGGSEAGTGINM